MKLFNIWDVQGITRTDLSIKNQITVKPQLVVKSQGRNANHRFYRNKNNIVERLISKLMVPGHKGKKHYRTSGRCAGKYIKNTKIVIEALKIVEKKTDQNPIQVLVTAIENAAPREEITTIEYGGARYPQAVDCSPQRKVDLALRMMTQGAYQKSFGKKVQMPVALAEEIITAFKLDQKSVAVAKKLELERMADAAR
jgi:small subunit ribosomal protein S7